MSTEATAADPRATVNALKEKLASTPRAARPYEHASIAYRLGLAYAELPTGNHEENLRQALAHYQVAAAVFDPRFDPVEHGRVLNAAGAAHRALGDRRRAATLFEEATRLLDGRGRDGERAAAFNNLGLVRAELGQPDKAVEACDQAVALFDTDTAEGRRGRVAALHTRGQAHAALGTVEGLEAALADYEEARSSPYLDEAPYHDGLVHHSIGVTCSALAARRPEERERLLNEAVLAFSHTLRLFTRKAFPYQHAMTKYNLALAHAGLGGELDLRRALAGFEDATALFDPRVHKDEWKQAFTSLGKVEGELRGIAPLPSLAGHFAALIVDSPHEERLPLVRERLNRVLDQVEGPRDTALKELASGAAQLGPAREMAFLETVLEILMEEMNVEGLEATLRAVVAAHRQLGEEAQLEADAALDQAVSNALVGPQRISVRDYLYSIGWERP